MAKQPRFQLEKQSATRAVVYCAGGARWATLDRVRVLVFPAEYEDVVPTVDDPDASDACAICGRPSQDDHTSACEQKRERWQWVVRRIDWFDLTPQRDPTFQTSINTDELRSLLDILDALNHDEAPATVSPTVLAACREAYCT